MYPRLGCGFRLIHSLMDEEKTQNLERSFAVIIQVLIEFVMSEGLLFPFHCFAELKTLRNERRR